MNSTIELSTAISPLSEQAMQSPDLILEHLGHRLAALTPELQKAATYVLENPNEISICSIRELAHAAAVKPNSLVRMAGTLGFDSYEEFRFPFRERVRRGRENFPDRARWLQSVSREGNLGGLYADLAATAIDNIEQVFSGSDATQMQTAADLITQARTTYVLGVGINYSLARTFTYLVEMALDTLVSIPREGSSALDDLAGATSDDVLIAVTFKPYRTEILEAAHIARQQGVSIIGISDSAASPLVTQAECGFVVPTDTPQFFTSTFATGALLETLATFVIAATGPSAIDKFEARHQRRYDVGIYQQESESS